MTSKDLFILTLSVAAITAMAIVTTTRAQTSSALEISPPFQSVSMEPGEQKNIELMLRNISNSDNRVTPEFRDFMPLESGVPDVLAAGETNDMYGIKSWLTGSQEFSLAPGAIKTYSAKLSVPAQAEGKTRYGIIMFNGEEVSSERSIGSILLVDVGTPSYSARIVSIKEKGVDSTNTHPVDATYEITVENTGEYAFAPRVTANIVNDEGEVIGEATAARESPSNILPDSARLFEVYWSGSLDSSSSYKVVPQVQLPDNTTLHGNDAGVELYNPPEPENGGTEIDEDQNMLPFIAAGAAGVMIITVTTGVLIYKNKNKFSSSSVGASPPHPTPSDHSVIQPTNASNSEAPPPPSASSDSEASSFDNNNLSKK